MNAPRAVLPDHHPVVRRNVFLAGVRDVERLIERVHIGCRNGSPGDSRGMRIGLHLRHEGFVANLLAPHLGGRNEEALRLGTQDALLHFHAGVIAQALGDDADATVHFGRSQEINPYFSIRHSVK